ncbi:putative nucleotidyltransferase [Sphingomonas sp. BE138]|uniref:nucleotidyltransferase family protein n=1 Tax=Sphingomonas sp. BE138 TaxID=2817845 RepID=UPI002862CC3A|nr:nucleotidyltransferase domain-containing protein [Sphingomonas sp. BE138]MDR6788680.1 putative nucleotidyltransferase [Sphingomonas sp. BE138]
MTDDAITITDRERAIVGSVLRAFADRIDRVAVFGSRALGRARPASDIDLALYGSLDAAALARLWSLFDRSGLAVTTDLVHYEALGDVPLRRHIDRYAKTLFTHEDLA